MDYKPSEKDIDEIKSINGISAEVTKHDDYYRTMLPMLLEVVVGHTNNTFGGVYPDGSINLPGPVKIYLAKALERSLMTTGLKSRSMGSVSYSYDTSVPKELEGFLAPYKKVRFRASR
ncbi:phage head-tail connector protein [Planococcus koreensis]|uniref:phage head-tail connector protein n=1 Tax=Planococcus koreensis TaxID=112331 RepID=UPI0039FCCEDA